MAEKRLYSRIKRYISDDLYMKLNRLIYSIGLTNNEKAHMIQIYLEDAGVDYVSLGPGTNRYAVLIDQTAFKFALDEDGMIDNRREILYSQRLQPYVIKCYECTKNGLIMACERIEKMDRYTFRPNREAIAAIIKDIVKQGFLVGDIGLNEDNYANWGKRLNGEICCLDFAYIYNVKFNIFKCSCPSHPYLEYDESFVNLVCPVCHRYYKFGDIRKKISKKSQEEEIGDVLRLGYNLSQPEEIVEVVEEFSPPRKDPHKEKKIDIYEKNRRDAEEAAKKRELEEAEIDYDYPKQPLSYTED